MILELFRYIGSQINRLQLPQQTKVMFLFVCRYSSTERVQSTAQTKEKLSCIKQLNRQVAIVTEHKLLQVMHVEPQLLNVIYQNLVVVTQGCAKAVSLIKSVRPTSVNDVDING